MIDTVAPIYYAHLAAAQVGQLVKFEERSESNSTGPPAGPVGMGDTAIVSDASVGVAGRVGVKALPQLHQNVCETMFFC